MAVKFLSKDSNAVVCPKVSSFGVVSFLRFFVSISSESSDDIASSCCEKASSGQQYPCQPLRVSKRDLATSCGWTVNENFSTTKEGALNFCVVIVLV